MESHLLFVISTVVIGALVILCVYLRNFIRFVYLASRVPGPSLWEFLTIHAGKLMNIDTCMEAFTSLAKIAEYQPYGLWLKNGHFAIVVTDGESLRHVFKNTCITDKAEFIYDEMSLYMGKGLITLNGPEHTRHRRLLSPAFRKAALDAHLPEINEEISLLIERIREETGNIVDIEHLLKNKIKTTVSLLLTGKSFRAHEKYFDMFFDSAKVISGVIRIQSLNPLWPFIKWTKPIRTKVSYFWQAVDRLKHIMVEEKMIALKNLQEAGREPTNIAECIAQPLAVGEDGLTDNELLSELRHIFGAAAETTYFTECVCFYLLALHPDVQERVYDEIESILEGSDRAIEPEDLSRMVYLGMVIKETLRLFPPIPNIARRVTEETYIQGILLPKDSTVLIDFVSLHRNPRHFEDPLKFDPERFSAERSLALQTYTYLPFGYGKRDCIGQTYAIMTIKATISRIIRSFKVFPTTRPKCLGDIKFTIQVTFVVDSKPLRFVARNNKVTSSVIAK